MITSKQDDIKNTLKNNESLEKDQETCKAEIVQLEEDAYFKDLIESIKTYLIVVTKVSVQNINETLPRIKLVDILSSPPFPTIKECITYRGEVPMSP